VSREFGDIVDCCAAVLLDSLTGPLCGPATELSTSLGILDLHNFADFSRLTFDRAGTLELEWQATDSQRMLIGKEGVGVARLVFTWGYD